MLWRYPDASLAIVIWWTLIYDILLQVNVIILSYLTNVIVSSLGEDSNEGCLNQLFLELFSQNDGLFAFCQSYPQVRIFLAHPNIRLQPSWYSRLRPVIIRVMHRFLQTKPPNLLDSGRLFRRFGERWSALLHPLWDQFCKKFSWSGHGAVQERGPRPFSQVSFGSFVDLAFNFWPWLRLRNNPLDCTSTFI